DQLTEAVKISASTSGLGELSLTASDLPEDHNNKPVYCVAIKQEISASTSCKGDSIDYELTNELVVRASDRIRVAAGFLDDDDALGELMAYRYDQAGNGNFLIEQFTELSNGASPGSSFNLTISKSAMNGTMAISAKDPQGVYRSSSSIFNLTIPLAIP
ncbi:MAG: hypothetical protein AAFN68_04990, partial [Pseudomonadota bacterium]